MRTLFWMACFFGMVTTSIAQESFDGPQVLPQQPPDFKVGQLVEWEGWSFRWQFRDIEGGGPY